jgi:uncharacterized protein YjbI with pentapeptide repeats
MVITTVEGRLGSTELPEPDPRFWGGPGRFRRGLRILWSRGTGARLLLLSLAVSFVVTVLGAILWIASKSSQTVVLGAALLAGGLAGSAALLVGLVSDARATRSEIQNQRFAERQSLQLTIALFTDLVRIDLSHRDLSGFFLRGRNLTEANLAGANLEKANLEGANLVKVNLTGARLAGCNLRGANLRGAVLTESDLSLADLGGAKLVKANLTRANLTRAYLAGTILPTAGPQKALHSLTTGADLTGADLTEAILTRANLTGAVLTETNLSGADLSESNPITATLSGAVYDSRTRWPQGFHAPGAHAAASRSRESRERTRPGATDPPATGPHGPGSRREPAERASSIVRTSELTDGAAAGPVPMLPLAPDPN